jgi:hypothetical protein
MSLLGIFNQIWNPLISPQEYGELLELLNYLDLHPVTALTLLED